MMEHILLSVTTIRVTRIILSAKLNNLQNPVLTHNIVQGECFSIIVSQ